MNSNNTPIVIDLDGTLLNSDLLFESFLKLVKQNPLYLFKTIIWVFQGKSILKDKIAEKVEIDVNFLPYNTKLIDFLRSQKGKRKLILASASNIKFVAKIAKHLDLFDYYLASDRNLNLSGRNKEKKLREILGNDEYVYAGNSWQDLPIWNKCKQAITVNISKGVLRKLSENSVVIKADFTPEKLNLLVWFKCLRIHQWSKNLLIFVPLVLSQQYFSESMLFNSLLAFFVFGMCASSVYLLNDLLDIEDDRKHKSKKYRPIPSGKVSFYGVIALIIILLGAAFYISVNLLPLEFTILLTSYYALTLMYTFFLKRKVILDVLVLSSLYTLRIVSGTAVIGAEYSFWLSTFSIFLFLSLALIKRYTELLQVQLSGLENIASRGYKVDDIGLLSSLGSASGYISISILALFINSDKITERYSSPELLWLIIPFLLYWISRAWLIAHRGEMQDDPVVFAIKDKVSRYIIIILVTILFGAIWL